MEKAQVILYTRPGCHLCEEAKRAIEAADCGDRYTLTEVNIETGPVLLDLYKHNIPIITIDGVQAFKHRVTAEKFREKLVSLGGAKPLPTASWVSWGILSFQFLSG